MEVYVKAELLAAAPPPPPPPPLLAMAQDIGFAHTTKDTLKHNKTLVRTHISCSETITLLAIV